MAFKRLGASAPANTTWTNLYTVPADKYAIVSTILCVNIDAANDATVRVVHKDNGIANEDYLLYDEPVSVIKGCNWVAIQLGICMAVGDDLQVYRNGGTVAFQAWGEEGDV